MVGQIDVSSNIDTCREVLGTDPPGPSRLVPTWDPGDWAEAIAAMLADATVKPRALRFAVAMRERHSNERMLAHYRELFGELIR